MVAKQAKVFTNIPRNNFKKISREEKAKKLSTQVRIKETKNMNFKTLKYVETESIGILTINRPEALNALNAEVITDLAQCLAHLEQSKTLRALIITGAGEKAFVAGADIKEMEAREPKMGLQMAKDGQRVFQMIEGLQVPVIAAVNGFALGGGMELALACDFIVASKKAKMGLPEVSLGLIPGYGGTQRLSRVAGKNIARTMILTGDIYSAEQMEKWGIASFVTEPEELMNTCQKLAATICTRSPIALNLAKKSINRGFDSAQIEGMNIEAELFHEVFNSKDKMEGIKSFIARKTPDFKI